MHPLTPAYPRVQGAEECLRSAPSSWGLNRDDRQILWLFAVSVPLLWHTCGMRRIRVSTTVDAELLARARDLHGDGTDAAVLDSALSALIAQHRAAEVDAAYAAYDRHPLDEEDEWGDLASFREAAARS